MWKHSISSYYFLFENPEFLGVTHHLNPFSFSFTFFFSFPELLKTLLHPLCSFSIISTVFHCLGAIPPVLSLVGAVISVHIKQGIPSTKQDQVQPKT